MKIVVATSTERKQPIRPWGMTFIGPHSLLTLTSRSLLAMSVKFLRERGSCNLYHWSPFLAVGSWFHRWDQPHIFSQHRWILTATNYFTKCVEVVPTRQETNAIIIEFLISNIISKFGCPRKIVTDNVKAFTSTKLVKFCNDYNIIRSHSTAYYP